MAIRNSVRVIGGAWRGRRVSFPDLDGLRPTPDRVRETLFNWLQQVIARSTCLDLFAGSGALGLESLSRGAKEVVFIEKSPLAVKSIREHLRLFGVVGIGGAGDSDSVIETDVERYLDGVSAAGAAAAKAVAAMPAVAGIAPVTALPVSPAAAKATAAKAASAAAAAGRSAPPFDLVFLDPPFGQNCLPRILPKLRVGTVIKPGGLVYLECERASGEPALPPGWEMLRSKSAGEVGYHLARVHSQVAQ